MTASTRARPPLVAIVIYSVRACVPGRRWFGLLLPCLVAILFGLLSRALGGDLEREMAGVAAVALFGLIMPVTCLVAGDAVLGAEVRSGAFTFTWMSPVPTWMVVAGRWAGGAIVSGACLAVAFSLAAVAGGAPGLIVPLAVAAVLGAVGYVAVFLAIGCATRRAAVWSIAFVFLVERLLGAALPGVAQLSPSWLARSAFLEWADIGGDLVRDGIPQGTAAAVRQVIVAVVALGLATYKLRGVRLTGSSD